MNEISQYGIYLQKIGKVMEDSELLENPNIQEQQIKLLKSLIESTDSLISLIKNMKELDPKFLA